MYLAGSLFVPSLALARETTPLVRSPALAFFGVSALAALGLLSSFTLRSR